MAPVHRLRSAGRLNLVTGSSLGPCCNPKSSAGCSIHNVNRMDNVVRNPHRPSQNIPVHKHYSIIYIYVRDIMKYHILYTFMYTYLYIDCNLCHNWSLLDNHKSYCGQKLSFPTSQQLCDVSNPLPRAYLTHPTSRTKLLAACLQQDRLGRQKKQHCYSSRN